MDSPRSNPSEHSSYSSTQGGQNSSYGNQGNHHMTPSPEYVAENVTIGASGISSSSPGGYEGYPSSREANQGVPTPVYYHPHPGIIHQQYMQHQSLVGNSTAHLQPGYLTHLSQSPQSSSGSSAREMPSPLTPKRETDISPSSYSSSDLPTPPPRKKHSFHDGPLQINEPSSTNTNAPVIRYCSVCNDIASGFHYGVWSCEGCKAFFKRSIQGPVDYVCPATNSCNIDKQRRKSCQACRLRRCFEAGMIKGGGNRRDRSQSRGRSSLQKRRQDTPEGLTSKNKKTVDTKKIVNNTSPEINEKLENFLKTIIKIEPNVVEADLPKGESEHTLMGTLVNLGDKQLVYMINWVKQIPGFNKILLNDQVRLLELCWCELLILWLAYRSKPYENCLCYAPGIIFDRKRHEIAEMGEVGDQMISLADHLRDLNVTLEEFTLLKVLVVANAETKFLESKKAILELQLLASDCLLNYEKKHYPQDSSRFMRFMLLLPHIRQTSDRSIMRMFLFKSSDKGSTVDLLYEMLESHCIAKETETTSHLLSKAQSMENLSSRGSNTHPPSGSQSAPGSDTES